MTSLLLFIIVVIVVLCLVYWAISLIPLPASPPIKTILLILAILIAAFLIAQRAGLPHR